MFEQGKNKNQNFEEEHFYTFILRNISADPEKKTKTAPFLIKEPVSLEVFIYRLFTTSVSSV